MGFKSGILSSHVEHFLEMLLKILFEGRGVFYSLNAKRDTIPDLDASVKGSLLNLLSLVIRYVE